MGKGTWLASAAIAVLSAGNAWAQDAQAVAAKFGAVEAIQQISLSPDGTKVAYVTPSATKGSVVYVADLAAGTPPTLAITSHGKDESIYWCGWASDTRLICNIHIIYNNAGQLLGFTRAFALNSDGSAAAMLSADTGAHAVGIMQSGGAVIDWDVPGKPGAVLMTRQFVEEERRGSNRAEQRPGFGVEEVDTVSVKRRTVERARPDAVEYLSDGHGTVRIMGAIGSDATGYAKSTVSYYFRRQGTKEWEPLSSVDGLSNGVGGFLPAAIDAGRNVVYGFDDKDGSPRYTASRWTGRTSGTSNFRVLTLTWTAWFASDAMNGWSAPAMRPSAG